MTGPFTQATRERVDEMHGKCSGCGEPFRDLVAMCSRCAMPLHPACWEAKGCIRDGCAGANLRESPHLVTTSPRRDWIEIMLVATIVFVLVAGFTWSRREPMRVFHGCGLQLCTVS